MTRSAQISALLLASALGVAGGGCEATGPRLVIATYKLGNAYIGGGVLPTGRLQVRNGCVIANVPGQGDIVPVFPQENFHVEKDRLVFIAPNGKRRTYQEGDQLDEITKANRPDITLPSDCPQDLPRFLVGLPQA